MEVITVDHHGTMTLARLKKLRDLVDDGAALLGEPPQATPGLSDLPQADDELKSVAMEIWGGTKESDRRFGKGRVFRGIPPEEALRRLGMPVDFSGPQELSWIHRRSGDADIYFIASSADEPVTATCTFRVTGKSAELWNPETGGRLPLETIASNDGQTTARVPLGPDGSAFVVFRFGDPVAASNSFESIGASDVILSINGPWSLSFPKDSGVAEPLKLETLASWSDHPDSGVRHFSGIAIYQTSFRMDSIPENPTLDLGRVGVMARVKLNGRDLGILWKPPYQVDIGDTLVQGQNELEISVVNLWVNRLIGDAALPDDSPRDRDPSGRLIKWPQWVLDGKQSPTSRSTFVTFPLWKADEKLQESGLLGPVTVKSSSAR